jgi:Ser/Thr protein kinase RdoA (MazF antagonist)
MDHLAAGVLQLFSLPGNAAWQRHRGGFSGAAVWRVRTETAVFCLRAWPADVEAATVHAIHDLLDRARQSGLEFIPRPQPAGTGLTTVRHGGHVWELTTWLPGRADFHDRPSAPRLRNACTALARLHSAWADSGGDAAPCPAIRRRLLRLLDWQRVLHSGWRPDFEQCADPSLRYWAEQAWARLPALIEPARRVLEPWTNVPLPLQPCLCDVWHDHVLFENDTVTGLVDYGSVKTDHVAVDVARLVGSLAGDDAPLRAAGLEAYQQTRTDWSDRECALVDVLDRTGTIVGATNWLRWLFLQKRAYDDVAGVTRRLRALVTRIQTW